MQQTILSIAGKPGLYELVSRGKSNLIVESLDSTHKRMPVFTTDRHRLFLFDTEWDGISDFRTDDYTFIFDRCPRGVALLCGEVMGPLAIVGGAMVVVGVALHAVLSSKTKKKLKAAEEAESIAGGENDSGEE